MITQLLTDNYEYFDDLIINKQNNEQIRLASIVTKTLKTTNNLQTKKQHNAVSSQQKLENILEILCKNQPSRMKRISGLKLGLNLNIYNMQKKQSKLSEQKKNKLNYQALRGGLYMQKVQNHLNHHHLNRKIDSSAQMMLASIQQRLTDRFQNRAWMDKTLGKINAQIQNDCQMQQRYKLKNIQKNSKYKSLNRKSKQNNNLQIYQKQNKNIYDSFESNEKKSARILSERLKKILRNKFVNNTSKYKKRINTNREIVKQIILNQNKPQILKKDKVYSSQQKSKQSFRIVKSNRRQQKGIIRAQTSQNKIRDPLNYQWKHSLNGKLNTLLDEAQYHILKSNRDKKQIKLMFETINQHKEQYVFF